MNNRGEEFAVDRERAKVVVFVTAVAVYYVLYFAVFAGRVKAYFADILRHFDFVRRFLG